MSKWVPALAAGVLLAATAVSAQDGDSGYRLFGQSTSYLELNQDEDGDSDKDYTKFKQLFSLNIEWSSFTAGAQVEYLYYSDPELADRLDLDRLREGFELRKYYFDYTSEKFNGRLGTFFSSFGRGLTLYVQKNDVLGFDEPLHGATATVTLDNLDITVLGGRVTEPLLAAIDDSVEDEILGGRILARLPYDLYLGGSVVSADLVDPFFPEVEVWAVEGGGSGIAGLFDVHGEWSELKREGATASKEGHGRYLSAASYFGAFSFLAEYKDYWNFDYRYNNPPNAGRDIETYDYDDVRGPRLLVDGDIAAIGAVFYASYGAFNSHDRDDSQNEWYVGVQETTDHLYLDLSYFNRHWSDRGIRERHTMADLHVSTGDRSEVILGYDKRLEKASFWSLATHRSFLAYSLSPWGTLSLRYSWEEKSNFDTEDFWGAELEFVPKPTMTLTVFAGADPGGLICAGGQCRIEPRFKGYKAKFIWRF